MRACEPRADGFVERDGVKVHYEVYGDGGPTVVLLPAWAIVHKRLWKMQLAYLSRCFRVVTFDGRGSGRSDRPSGAASYRVDEYVADTLAVLDATATERAVLVTCSRGALWGTVVAADHPQRVAGVVHIAPALVLAQDRSERARYGFDDELGTADGWAKYNAHHWRRDYRDFVEFFFAQALPEPHSTKQIEDCVGWGLENDPATLADTHRGIESGRTEPYRETCARIRCPVVVIHGDGDRIRSPALGAALAAATSGTLVTLAGSGHLPMARDPVRVNLLIKEFVDRVTGTPLPATTWTRGPARPKRALYLSSPIGIGHARRDVAIAAELRRLHPDLELDWLAQHPVTAVLAAEKERIHPASRWLANESAHVTSEAGGHDLHCFQALRRMDEILLANFMVFQEVVEEGRYDLVVGDEAWDVDRYWHENPELKRGRHVWLTDFVGYLPMPDGGPREAFLTADHNAEMIEHIDRHPGVRDRAIFVGDEPDVVADTFGAGLPAIRDWTSRHFAYAGYVTGFTPPSPDEVPGVRRRLGYRDDELVCLVAVGGSGVGRALIDTVLKAFPLARRALPELRMVVVTGPRIDPASVAPRPGLDVRGYVHRLHEHLGVCDLAVVQGGLTTTMELTAARRPFLYFPLAHHFEQTFHVAHRLDRHRAGRRMDLATTDPDAVARAIVDEIARPTDYAPVATDGAARAARLIAELL